MRDTVPDDDRLAEMGGEGVAVEQATTFVADSEDDGGRLADESNDAEPTKVKLCESDANRGTEIAAVELADAQSDGVSVGDSDKGCVAEAPLEYVRMPPLGELRDETLSRGDTTDVLVCETKSECVDRDDRLGHADALGDCELTREADEQNEGFPDADSEAERETVGVPVRVRDGDVEADACDDGDRVGSGDFVTAEGVAPRGDALATADGNADNETLVSLAENVDWGVAVTPNDGVASLVITVEGVVPADPV